MYISKSKPTFQEVLLNPDILSVTWELIPGRGALEDSQENVIRMAEQAAKGNMVSSVTITDNPGGKPALSVFSMSSEVSKLGIEPLIHFTCKDKNRNAFQSELYALERAGLKNLLIMTGDYPTEGYTGRAKPVFDIDSVQALTMIESMNKGEYFTWGKGQLGLKPTNFFAGAVVSPFKNTEAEQVTQYYKLLMKLKSGAKFIVTQLGYDPRKYDELYKFTRLNNINVPLIGNIFVLSANIAGVMNRNLVPGCVVTDEMLKTLEDEKTQFGNSKERQILRAAKLYAVLKGLKYDGVNISGHGLKYSDIEYIIGKGEELSRNWQDVAQEFQACHKNSFYYFKKDNSSGLNTFEPVDTKTKRAKKFSISYKIFEGIHRLFFSKKGFLYPVMKATVVASHGNVLGKLITGLEYGIKRRTHDCCECGDCAMFERAYICPMSQCPKQQRNGPCGGSFNGWCEVYPNTKKCIYVRAYELLKSDGKEENLKKGYIRPCNWDLYKTSSWYNYYSGKDWQGLSNFADEQVDKCKMEFK
jgi:methylenetetrahydrofolate reductase (NADPH)